MTVQQSTIRTVEWYSSEDGALVAYQDVNVVGPMDSEFDDFEQNGWSLSGVGPFIHPVDRAPARTGPLGKVFDSPSPLWWWVAAASPPLIKRYGYTIPYYFGPA